MELMDISLDKFYKFIYGTLGSSIPEDILGKITVAVSVCFYRAPDNVSEYLKII